MDAGLLTIAALMLGSFAAGAVAGIFVYRNNRRHVDPVADAADAAFDAAKKKRP